MERMFWLNWQALIEEAKQRRKTLKVTQKRLSLLANVSAPTISHFENGEKDIQLSSILNILGILGMLDTRNLLFEVSKNDYEVKQDRIIFTGYDNGKKISCAITLEALFEHYKNTSKKPALLFLKYRSAIEHEARRKYLANRFEADNTILIQSKDFT